MTEVTAIELFVSQSFPVAVAVYLLIRMENRIKELDDTIESLNTTINVLCHSKSRAEK